VVMWSSIRDSRPMRPRSSLLPICNDIHRGSPIRWGNNSQSLFQHMNLTILSTFFGPFFQYRPIVRQVGYDDSPTWTWLSSKLVTTIARVGHDDPPSWRRRSPNLVRLIAQVGETWEERGFCGFRNPITRSS
jgi:hypothetical protein